MTRRSAIIVGLAASAAYHAVDAQPRAGLSGPVAGWFVAERNALRPVSGLAGNFVVGDPAASGVISAASSGRFIAVKRQNTVEWLDQNGQSLESRSAPEGPALFAFTRDGHPALTYFPGTSEWFPGPPAPPSAMPVGEVLAISQPEAGSAGLILARGNDLWLVRLRQGRIEDERLLTGAQRPVLFGSDGAVLFAAGSALVVEPISGAERRIELPAVPAELQPMGEGWVFMRMALGQGRFVLRLSPDREELYRLPEVSP